MKYQSLRKVAAIHVLHTFNNERRSHIGYLLIIISRTTKQHKNNKFYLF